MHRARELGAFLDFVLSKPLVFNSPVVDNFFDSMLPDTKAGEVILKYTLPNHAILAQRFAELYPQYVESKCTPQHKVTIEKFREKIRINVDFYEVG